MLVDLNVRAPCAESGICALALACMEDGLCGPCTSDLNCPRGERCVLDRCLSADAVECSTSTECPPQHSCILSGFGAGERHNEGMRSRCLDPKSEMPQIAVEYPAAEFIGEMTAENALHNALTERMGERGSSE